MRFCSAIVFLFCLSAVGQTWSGAMVDCRFPGEHSVSREVETGFDAIRFRLSAEKAAPALTVTVWVANKDGVAFQSNRTVALPKGTWTTFVYDFSPDSPDVRGVAHDAGWCRYYCREVNRVTVQFSSNETWKGKLKLEDIDLTPIEPRELAITGLTLIQPEMKQFGTGELRFCLAASGNPFDPDNVKASGVVKAPDGSTRKVPAFFHQDYRRALVDEVERLTPTGLPHWHLRLAPEQVGRYEYKLIAKQGEATVETGWHSFECVPSELPGRLRVSQTDPRFFETSRGDFFYPLGTNVHAPFDKRSAKMLGIPVSPNRGTFAYDELFAKMAASGQNACVVWLAPWWLEFEWSAKWKGFGGLTDYNLANAWRLDHMLKLAEKHGIYLHLVLENHGKYSLFVDPQWASNPYNVKNGGMLRTPEDFFTSIYAWNVYRKKLRYLIARVGHSPWILGLELFGEINITGNNRKFMRSPLKALWVKRTAQYLREIDHNRHLVTVHYSNDWKTIDPQVASLPELDYIVGDTYKAAGAIPGYMVETYENNNVYGKPTFSTEFGGNWNGTSPKRLTADLHAGLWSNFMTQSAAAPFFWWYDFIDRHELYSHYSAFTKYIAGEDKRGPFETSSFELKSSSSRTVKALMLSTPDASRDKAYLWVYDEQAMEVMPGDKYAPLIEDASVPLDLTGKRYTVEFWNTYDGKLLASVNVSGTTQLRIPSFKRDIAAKLIRIQPEEGQ